MRAEDQQSLGSEERHGRSSSQGRGGTGWAEGRAWGHIGFSEGDLCVLWQPVQGRRSSSQQPGATGGTRIQGCGYKETRGLCCRPLTPGWEGPENIPSPTFLEAAARSSWLPEVGSGPRTSLLCAAGSRWGGDAHQFHLHPGGLDFLSSSNSPWTPYLGQWAKNHLWLLSLSNSLPRDGRTTMCQGLGAVSQPHLCQSLPGDSTLLSLFLPLSHHLAGLLEGQHLVVAREVLSPCMVQGFPQLASVSPEGSWTRLSQGSFPSL